MGGLHQTLRPAAPGKRLKNPALRAGARNEKTKRRTLVIPQARKRIRGAAGASRRSVLGAKGSRRMVLPKGEIESGEDILAAAQREFREETGIEPREPFLPLGSVAHKSGKQVTAWAFAGDCDPAAIRSNTFRLEWPPRSGKFSEFAEIDRAAFFTLEEAREKMHEAEFAFVLRLREALGASS